MKTEELKAQGLTQEQINFVMAENGKIVTEMFTDYVDNGCLSRSTASGNAYDLNVGCI